MTGTLDPGEVPISILTSADIRVMIDHMNTRNDAPNPEPVAILNKSTFSLVMGMAYDGTRYRTESKRFWFRLLRWLYGDTQ